MTASLFRVVLRAPSVAVALAAALAAGGLGAAYPAAVLAEPTPPGLFAGALLGCVGAGLLAPIWGVPLAAAVTGGTDASGPRVALHASGCVQAAIRRAELGATAFVALLLVAAAALAGIASAVAQQVVGGSFAPGLGSAPAASAIGLAGAVALGAVVVGWALGIVAGSVVTACAAYGGAAALTTALAGIAYFAPPFKVAAALSPFGAILGALRDELLAPQFTVGTPYAMRVVSACAWSLVLAAAVAWRLGRRVR